LSCPSFPYFGYFLPIIVREQNAVASAFQPLFSSQFRFRWSTTRILGTRDQRFPANPQPMTPALNTTRIYVDADACPVKDEIYRVAARYSLPVSVVAGQFIRVPQDPMIERVAAGSGMDAADDWIAERAGPGDIVVTSDIPLASRCVKAGAEVIAPNGKPFTEQSMGMTLAVRNLMTDLRSSGEVTGGPKSFAPRDRSAFLSALDQTIRRIQRQRIDASAQNQN
jgi:uncharacterized protein